MAQRSDDARRRRRLVTSTVQSEEAEAPSPKDPSPEAPAPAAGDPDAAPKGQGPAAAAAETDGTAPAAAAPPDPEATSFGEGDRAWAAVEISEDRMQAVLTALALNGLSLTAKELAHELAQAFGLRGTFDGKVLRRLVAEAATQVVRGSHVLLKGTPCTPGEDGRVVITCVRGGGDPVNQALAADLAGALGAESLAEALEAAPTAITIGPGDAIARVVPPTEGAPGRDVHGQAVEAPGQEAACEAGANTRREDDEILAEVFGYVRRAGSTFEVVPPVWIAADAMAAHVVHFTELRRLPPTDRGWITGALEAAGVVHGLDEPAIDALCRAWPPATEVTSIAVAAGTPAVDGVDAHLEYSFDPSKRAGAVRPDGSIDYRERNAVVGAAEGSLIGKVVAATPGSTGTDVAGKELAARDGEDKAFVAGANVTGKSEDGTTAFYSDIDGAVNVSAESIEVQPIFTISGDVDYETGNIDVPMNVEIGGSVKPEFKVRSEGSVTVGGVLEPGCQVEAGGDVVVARGIFGDRTRVRAKGNVETKLIQNGRLTLDGDLTVGSYLYNAIVHAGGSVTVEEGGGQRAGSIVGGEVIAGTAIRAKLFGSEGTDRTLVGLGATPDQQRELAEARRAEAAAGGERSRLLDALDLQGTDEADLEARRKRCRDEADLGRVEAWIAELRAALLAGEQAQAARERLEGEVAAALAAGTVQARKVHGDVTVDFGGQVSRVDEPLTDAEFYLAEDGVCWRPAVATEPD